MVEAVGNQNKKQNIFANDSYLEFLQLDWLWFMNFCDCDINVRVMTYAPMILV